MELERAVDTLTGQVQQLLKVKEEKEELDKKNIYLEKKLLEKQSEIDEIKIKMQKQEKTSCCDSSQSSKESLVEDCTSDAKLFNTRVEELKIFLHLNQLDPKNLMDPSQTHNISEEILTHLGSQQQ